MHPSLSEIIAHNDAPLVLLTMLACGFAWGMIMAPTATFSPLLAGLRVLTVLCAAEIASGVGQMWTYHHLVYPAAHLTYLPEWACFSLGYGLGVAVMHRREGGRQTEEAGWVAIRQAAEWHRIEERGERGGHDAGTAAERGEGPETPAGTGRGG